MTTAFVGLAADKEVSLGPERNRRYYFVESGGSTWRTS